MSLAHTVVVVVANRTSITVAAMQLLAHQLVSLKVTSATAEVVDVDVDHTAVVVCTAKRASGTVAAAVEVEVLTQMGTPTTPQPATLRLGTPQLDTLRPDTLRLDTLITHQYAIHVVVAKASIAKRRVGVATTAVVACSQVAEFMIACSAISMRLTRAAQDTLPTM